MARPKLDQPRYRLTQRDGIYYVRWWENGSWNRVSTRTTDRREAERLLAQIIAGSMEPAPPAEVTIGTILDGYLADREGRVASHDTLKYACASLKRHLGDLTPENLSIARSRLYAQQRRDEGFAVGKADSRRRKSVSDGTITRELVTLRSALRWAMSQTPRWITDEPKIEVPQASDPRQRWLSRDEAALLIDACELPHVRLFVMLGLYTAARAGALLELTWDQVDFKTGIIELGRGTGNKRRAPVPIAPALLPYLLRARSGATSAYVIEHRGKRVASIKTAFGTACRKAHLNNVVPHTLRHTAATWLAMGGHSMAEIAKFLGNSEKVTEKVYAKYHPSYLRDVVTTLG
jgi:integrase